MFKNKKDKQKLLGFVIVIIGCVVWVMGMMLATPGAMGLFLITLLGLFAMYAGIVYLALTSEM